MQITDIQLYPLLMEILHGFLELKRDKNGNWS
jgi:hypothetical protein